MKNELMSINKVTSEVELTTNEIAELTGKRHDNVLVDTRTMLTELYGEGGLLKFEETYIHPQNKQSYPCYKLPKNEVLILVSGYSIPLRAAIVRRLDELEKQNKLIVPDFTNPAEAARAWALEYEEKQKALCQIEADKPKVLFADSVATSKSEILIGDLAKLIKQNGVDIGQKRLFEWLRVHGYLMQSGSSKNMPTQRSMELKLFRVKENSIVNADGSIRITRTTKVTGKGQVYLVNKFLAENLEQEAA